LKKLDDGGITINVQLVLCKGINDGLALTSTLTDLIKLKNLDSVSLVPCGLTGHREGLYPLEPFDKLSASEVIDTANHFGDYCLSERGARLIYPSDEFYLVSEREIPDEDYYESYPQIESGVGMIRSDTEEFMYELENTDSLEYNRKVSIATGEAAYDFICSLSNAATEKYKNLSVSVYAVKNNFFGGSVTVSGLVTGGDIIAQLSGKELGEALLIPENMLRAEGDLFLDDTSVEAVSERLGVPIVVVRRGGDSLFCAMTGKD
jgi:NifB/MoaA-like Fe-S oxidoreductase